MSTPPWEADAGQLGSATLARKWKVDVNTGTVEAPEWTRVRGISELSPTEEANTEDTTDMDSDGWNSSTNTGMSWGLELTVQRKTAEDGKTYDPGQEALRIKSDKQGLDNVANIRYYEYNGPNGPKVHAYSGQVGVAYSEGAGSPTATSTATITLSGQGRRFTVDHPAGTGA